MTPTVTLQKTLTNSFTRFCSECGKPLPEEVHGNTLYCKKCLPEVNRDQARDRKRNERTRNRERGCPANRHSKGTMFFIPKKIPTKKDGSVDFKKQIEQIQKEKHKLRL